MADAPSPPWTLPCPWCDFYVYVNNRGASRRSEGAGVEAARLMKSHVEKHGRTWDQFLDGVHNTDQERSA